MKPIKITELKVTAGKDIFLFTPKSAQVVVGGKSFFLDEKLAAALWKVIASPMEKTCNEMKDFKP